MDPPPEMCQGDLVELTRLLRLALLSGARARIARWLLRLPWLRVRSTAGKTMRRVVILTQTCDLRNEPADPRQYVQVGRVVEISDTNKARTFASGWSARYIPVPWVGENCFVDLDVINSVDKALLKLARRSNPMPADEARKFAWSIARNFQRYPFPDDLAVALSGLRDRVKNKWQRTASPEGRQWKQVRQIRASADPGWAGTSISVSLAFIFERGVLPPVGDEPEPISIGLRTWLDTDPTAAEIAAKIESSKSASERLYLYYALVDAWAHLCGPHGVITSVDAAAADEDEYSVAQYWESEVLDLNQLSGPFTS